MVKDINNSQKRQLALKYEKPFIIIPNKNGVLIFSFGEAMHKQALPQYY